MNRILKILGNFIDSTYGALFVTSLPVATGIFFAIFKESILSAFPFYMGPNWGSVSLCAIMFWSIPVIFSVCFFLRQSRQDKKSETRQNDLLAASANLNQTIRAMPSQQFLATTTQRLKACIETMSSILAANDIMEEEYDKAITMILGQIVLAAADFDDAPIETRYATNIMVFEKFDGLDATELENWISKIDLGSIDRSRLQGVLKTITKWSAMVKIGDNNSVESPDQKLVELYLPVPKTEYSKFSDKRWGALPGAPLANVSGQANYYSNTSSLTNWMQEQQEFPKSEIEKFDLYFNSENGKLIQSFASFPVNNDSCCIVVNIHRDCPGILRSNEQEPKDFSTIISPFLTILQTLICAKQQ